MKEIKLEWIEALKFVGIIAVILGHIASPLGTFIFSWHMPLFFIMAGFFIKVDLSVEQFIAKEFKRLIIPYFIFSGMALVLETLKRILLHREALDLVDSLVGVFIWMDMDALIDSYAFVLWFLPALFFARLLTYLILKVVDRTAFQLLLVMSAFIVSFYLQLPFAIDNALNAFVFVYVGYFLFKIDNNSYWPLVLLALIFVYYMNDFPVLNMSQKHYGSVVVNIAWAVACSYILISVIRKFNKIPNVITLWGSNTMLLFILHPYTNNIAIVVIDIIGSGSWYFKLLLSIAFLQCVLLIKNKYHNRLLFKYV